MLIKLLFIIWNIEHNFWTITLRYVLHTFNFHDDLSTWQRFASSELAIVFQSDPKGQFEDKIIAFIPDWSVRRIEVNIYKK